jgi:hypothetical protein
VPTSLEPNKSYTISIGIENDSDSLLVLHGELQTPGRWQAFLTKHNISLEAHEKTFQVSTIRVPLAAAAGTFPLTYLISNVQGIALDSISIKCKVPELREVEIIGSPLPIYSLSGDSLNFEISVKNKSNMPIQLKNLDPHNRSLEKVTLFQEELAINEARVLHFSAQISKDIEKSQSMLLELPIEIRYANGGREQRAISYQTQVIPVDSREGDIYNNLNLVFNGQSRYAENDLNSYYSITGNSYLDAKRRQYLSFNYSGNDQQGGFLSRENRSSATWQTPYSTLTYGDTNLGFVSSKINSQSGRGASLALNSRYLNLYAGNLQDLDSFTDHYAFAASVKPWRYSMHKVSHAFSDQADNVFTAVENQIRINNILNFDAEIASNHDKGKQDNSYAYDLSWQPSLNNVNFKSRYFYKPSAYTGTEEKSTQFNNALRFNALSRYISLYFDKDSYDIKNKYQKEELRFAGETSITGNFNTQLEYKIQDTDFAEIKVNEKVINSIWYYDRDFEQLQTRHSATFSINQLDEGSKRLSQTYRSSFLFPYDANNTLRASFTLNSKNENFSYQNLKTLSSSFNLHSILSNRLSNSFSYSNNLFLHKHSQMSNSFSNNLNYKYADNYVFSLNTGLSFRQKHNYWFASLGLNYRLGIPLQERRDISYLKGRIVDQNNIAIEKKIMKLNQDLAISNKDGEFIFAALRDGSYKLDVIDSDSHVMTPALPLQVQIKADSLQYLTLTQASASAILGQVKLFKPVANWFMQDEPEFYEAGPFSALLITLSNGVTSYSTASDIRGNFSFKRLQPGQWTLKIDKNSLPKNYETEWEELNIVLSAAQDIEIIIKVSEKLKRVIIRQID